MKPSYGTENCHLFYCVNHALDGMVPTGKSRRTCVQLQFEEMLQHALDECNGTKETCFQKGHTKPSVCLFFKMEETHVMLMKSHKKLKY